MTLRRDFTADTVAAGSGLSTGARADDPRAGARFQAGDEPPDVGRFPSQHSDADFIATCEQHIKNWRAYNAEVRDLEADEDPLWAAYMVTHDAISEAEPQTIEGMLAKARVALVEVSNEQEHEAAFSCSAHEWAWDVMNDLLRLHGEGST